MSGLGRRPYAPMPPRDPLPLLGLAGTSSPGLFSAITTVVKEKTPTEPSFLNVARRRPPAGLKSISNAPSASMIYDVALREAEKLIHKRCAMHEKHELVGAGIFQRITNK